VVFGKVSRTMHTHILNYYAMRTKKISQRSNAFRRVYKSTAAIKNNMIYYTSAKRDYGTLNIISYCFMWTLRTYKWNILYRYSLSFVGFRVGRNIRLLLLQTTAVLSLFYFLPSKANSVYTIDNNIVMSMCISCK